MPDDFRKHVTDILHGTSNRAMLRFQQTDDIFLVLSFVELGVLEIHGKSAESFARNLFGQGRNDGGVEPAAQVRAYWHVGPQAKAGRVTQQLENPTGTIFLVQRKID